MRILLAQKLPYVPALNGASRVARCLLEKLAERNHAGRVVALTAPNDPADREFIHSGVAVRAFASAPRLHERLSEQAREFDPDWIVVSEDPTYLLLAAAVEFDSRRVLYLAQSQATLPFGPEAFAADGAKRRLIEEAAGILATSGYLQSYTKRWGGLESFVLALPVYGAPPLPRLGSFDNPYATLINPSAIKGLPIFVALARRFPDIEFAAVPTWATTAADRGALAALPNVTLLESSENIDEIFHKTRVLLAPSLWGEAFGLVVVEAMLRGIPVLASDVGGLPEAKLGVDYVLPVRPIESYEKELDANGIPVPIVPDQDIDPWAAALKNICGDKNEFDRLAEQSRNAATDYAATLSIHPTERHFEDLLRRRASAGAIEQQKDDLTRRIEALSPEKLAALAAHLKRKS